MFREILRAARHGLWAFAVVYLSLLAIRWLAEKDTPPMMSVVWISVITAILTFGANALKSAAQRLGVKDYLAEYVAGVLFAGLAFLVSSVVITASGWAFMVQLFVCWAIGMAVFNLCLVVRLAHKMWHIHQSRRLTT
jgi:hypothetical protein